MEFFRIYTTNPTLGVDYIDIGEEPYILREFDGTSQNLSTPQTVKGPQQIGTTFINTVSAGRTVTISARVVADTWEELHTRKATLASALAIEPTTGLTPPSLLTLEYHRDGFTAVRLSVVPVESPQFKDQEGAIASDADMEFYAPDAYWTSDTDEVVNLASTAGGFQFPLQLPVEIVLATTSINIFNVSDYSAPMVARIFGSITGPRLVNVTTGEILEISGTIATGSYIEIDTSFGHKSITLVEPSTTSNVFDRLVLGSVFWQLRPGTNTVKLESSSSSGGSATIVWRPRFSGV